MTGKEQSEGLYLAAEYAGDPPGAPTLNAPIRAAEQQFQAGSGKGNPPNHYFQKLWQILLIRLAKATIVRMGGLPKDLGSRLASAT